MARRSKPNLESGPVRRVVKLSDAVSEVSNARQGTSDTGIRNDSHDAETKPRRRRPKLNLDAKPTSPESTDDADASSKRSIKRRATAKESLSVGQVAIVLGISRQRVASLLDAGEIEGSFLIPSTGVFASKRMVPVQSVNEARERWRIKRS